MHTYTCALTHFCWRGSEHKLLSRDELRQRKGLLSSFMLLEMDPPLSEQFLRDITINFLLAGRDTTAQTLLWNTFFVSQSPNVEAQLLQELQRLQLPDIPTTSDQVCTCMCTYVCVCVRACVRACVCVRCV